MIGYSKLSVAFHNILEMGLVDEIFHSVVIRDTGTGHKKPSAPVETKFVYCGIDDRKGFLCYCRALGPLEPLTQDRVGSCGGNIQKVRILNRLVFYNHFEERGHDDLTAILLNAVIAVNGIRLSRLHTNAEDFIKQEQPTGTFTLTPNSFYIAIDFFVSFDLNPSNCGTNEIGCKKGNPICFK